VRLGRRLAAGHPRPPSAARVDSRPLSSTPENAPWTIRPRWRQGQMADHAGRLALAAGTIGLRTCVIALLVQRA
jgi:hypothetical protein